MLLKREMRKGEWINLIREGVLGMTQKEFAKWLTEETGIEISSQQVARIENWGAKDALNPIKPSEEIINLLTSLIPSQPGETIPVMVSDLPDHVITSSSSVENLENVEISQTRLDKASSIGEIQKTNPVYYYYPAIWRPSLVENDTLRYSISSSSVSSSTANFTIIVQSSSNGKAIEDAHVIAFTSFKQKQGAQGQNIPHCFSGERGKTTRCDHLV